jgi:type IV secretion system protein VirB5
MKRVYYVYVALFGLACPIAASAQGIPVHDNANLLQQIQAVRQALQIVAQGKAQIAEAQKLYQDLNKLTDIPRLAQQLKTDALRELDTSGGSLQGFGTGNLDVVGAGRAKADAVYRGLLDKLGLGGSEQSRAAFDLNARNIGIQAGLADDIGTAVTSRAQGLEQLRSRLASAGTAKEVADLTAADRARALAGQAALTQKMEAANHYYRGQ